MNDPLQQLQRWLAEERAAGVPFAHGAVLGTTAPDGMPHTRMLGVHFSADGWPRFHTSPGSRKVMDLANDARVSLTFGFQRSLRSVSIEGTAEPLDAEQLRADWLTLDADFRSSYRVFGPMSGQVLASDEALTAQRLALPLDAEQAMPPSFIGYRLATITRVAVYAVGEGEFAQAAVYRPIEGPTGWLKDAVAP